MGKKITFTGHFSRVIKEGLKEREILLKLKYAIYSDNLTCKYNSDDNPHEYSTGFFRSVGRRGSVYPLTRVMKYCTMFPGSVRKNQLTFNLILCRKTSTWLTGERP